MNIKNVLSKTFQYPHKSQTTTTVIKVRTYIKHTSISFSFITFFFKLNFNEQQIEVAVQA